MTTLLKIGTTDITSYIRKPKGYKVGRNKLWTGAGRNMAGELKATFIGIFPKVTVDFTYLTETQLGVLTPLLDQASFTLYWWDARSSSLKSGTYYASDYEIPLFDETRDLYEPFSVSLIPFKKVTYS